MNGSAGTGPPDAPSHPTGRGSIVLLRRVAALLCLGSAYQCAVNGFAPQWLALLVVSALVVATGPPHWLLVTREPQPLPWPDPRVLWSQFVPGWLLMIVAACAKAVGVAPQIVICVWLGGTVWVINGAWLAARQRRGEEPHTGFSVWLWALVIVAIASALRLWEIGTVPRYVHCDEGTINLAAQQFYANPARDWFAPPPNAGSYSIMQLHFALAGAGTLLFGFNLFGARAADVFLGICSIVLLFDGLRRVATLRVAVVSALLLAVNHCHIAYSRIASGYIQTAFVVALVFAVLSRVWTAPTYVNSVLLGLVMALGIQTYPASLVSLPLFVFTMFVLAMFHPRRRRSLATPACIYLLTLLSAGAPFAAAVWQHGDALFNRSRDINIFSAGSMDHLKTVVYKTDSTVAVAANQAWNSLLGFHRGRDTQPQYAIDRPLADAYTAALLIPGTLFALLCFRRFVATNALVLTAGYLLLGLGMQYAPGHNRATGALPPGMVLAAIGLVQCCATLWCGRGWPLRWALNLSLAAALGLCFTANVHTYFVHYLWSRTVGDAQSEAGWIAREYAHQYTVHLASWPLPASGGYEGLRLIIADIPVVHHEKRDAAAYVADVTLTGADLFILHGENTEALGLLMTRFPEARLEVFHRHPTIGPKLFLVFIGEPRVKPGLAYDPRLLLPSES